MSSESQSSPVKFIDYSNKQDNDWIFSIVIWPKHDFKKPKLETDNVGLENVIEKCNYG